MSNFEETLARMKNLYTYGKDLNESNNNIKTHTLEYHAIAADGKSYGIIRECNKYYIKSAPKDKEMVAESYDYIGGFCNKKNYEYNSYSNALKNFELKMASINEANEGNVNISTLDPFKKEDFLSESTDKMKNEIARQRQIMYNASMIMNEANEIGATEKNNVVKKQNPNEYEVPKKNGNSINDGTEAKVVDQDKVKGFSGNNPHKDKTSGPYTVNPSKVNEGTCQKCGKEKCDCKNCNEEASDIGDSPLLPNTENWGTEGIGKGRDPKQVGWEMDGQQNVNEETNEWDEGLPSPAGIGEADTDHNNDPFNNSINEGDEDEIEYNEEDIVDDNGDETIDINFDDFDDETDDLSNDTDFDDGIEDEFSDDNDSEDEYSLDISSDEENDDDFDTDKFNDEEEFDDESEEFGDEEEFDDESEEFGNEEEFDDGSEKFDDEEEFDDESEEFDDDEHYDEELDECGDFDMLKESKQRKMNKIVESVVKSILKEEELHVFGKHPGYRKKPMELPTTGEDQNQWGRDWNDDSVHSEEPFGKQIGNGDPFNQLVNAVTKDVMYQLKKGVPIEGDKKKVN